jgi:hypothetical protein
MSEVERVKSIRIVVLFVALALMLLTVPLAFACEGKVTGGGQCIVGDNTEIPSASFGFNAMVTGPGGPGSDDVKGELDYVDHITGEHFHMHIVWKLLVTVDEPGNKPWPMMRADFEGPCLLDGVNGGYWAYVTVRDKGEPGKDDCFFIQVIQDNAVIYTGGSLDVPILAGNIQIHKPMWIES